MDGRPSGTSLPQMFTNRYPRARAGPGPKLGQGLNTPYVLLPLVRHCVPDTSLS